MSSIEKERVKQSLRLVAIDPFGLRDLIPERFKPLVIKTIRKIMNRKRKNDNFIEKYSTSNFFIAKNSIEDCLDLVGVCKK